MSVLGDEWQDGVRRPAIVALHGGPGLDGAKLRWLWMAVLGPGEETVTGVSVARPGERFLDYGAVHLVSA